jgi:hypothetical protein
MPRLYSRKVQARTERVYRGAMSAFGTKRTSNCRAAMSAFGGKADIGSAPFKGGPYRTAVPGCPSNKKPRRPREVAGAPGCWSCSCVVGLANRGGGSSTAPSLFRPKAQSSAQTVHKRLMLARIEFHRSTREKQTMLRTFAVALLATSMSVGLAEAKGHKPKATLAPCQSEQQVKGTCACGPAKIACPAGMYCHAFMNSCTK